LSAAPRSVECFPAFRLGGASERSPQLAEGLTNLCTSRMFALPWKSGPSGPRKSSEIFAGFSPGGRYPPANHILPQAVQRCKKVEELIQVTEGRPSCLSGIGHRHSPFGPPTYSPQRIDRQRRRHNRRRFRAQNCIAQRSRLPSHFVKPCQLSVRPPALRPHRQRDFAWTRVQDID
jgi:hypothetical protein